MFENTREPRPSLPPAADVHALIARFSQFFNEKEAFEAYLGLNFCIVTYFGMKNDN